MRHLILAIALIASMSFATESAGTSDANAGKESKSDWRIQLGVSAGAPTPFAITAGFGYQSALFRIQGMGWKNGTNDYWCNARGGIAWTFFRELPFNLDLGVGGGYSFAEAPNGYNKALNEANNARYVLPYNYEETLDISAEVWIHLFGFFTQIAYPVHFFMDHDTPTIIWRAGYLAEF